MTYGSRLNRYSLSKDKDGLHYFLWQSHHSMFDGWSLQIITSTLFKTYYDLEIQALKPYSSFIRYISQLDKSAAGAVLTNQLQGAQRASFPPRPSATSPGGATDQVLVKAITSPASPAMSVTKATVIRAAWSLVLASYCGTDDVTFGATVSGRQAPVPGLESMPGPMIATLPIGVRLSREQRIGDFLQSMQDQALDMISDEQSGLQNIAKLDPAIKDACNFSSLMIIQPF